MKEITKKKVLVIIPCYNEAESIGKLLTELKSVKDPDFDITPLPVNDCSKDNTVNEILNHNVHFLNLPVNLGIGGAVQSGLIYAYRNNFDIAIQMDGDGQHPPEELHKIVSPILFNVSDVVIGSRFIDKKGFQSTLFRRFGINFLSNLIKFCSGKKVLDCTSGYRAFNKKAISLCVQYYPDKYPEPESIVYLLKHGLTVKEVPVIMRSRTGGISSIGGFGSLYYMIKVSLAILFLNLKSSKK